MCLFVMILLTRSLLPGHCLHEIFALREGKIGRVPDMVIWPSKLFVDLFLNLSVFRLPCSVTDPSAGLGGLKG